jgi:hypothetical protein
MPLRLTKAASARFQSWKYDHNAIRLGAQAIAQVDRLRWSSRPPIPPDALSTQDAWDDFMIRASS